MVKTPESKAWASPAKIGRDQEDSSTGTHLGQPRGACRPGGGIRHLVRNVAGSGRFSGAKASGAKNAWLSPRFLT